MLQTISDHGDHHVGAFCRRNGFVHHIVVGIRHNITALGVNNLAIRENGLDTAENGVIITRRLTILGSRVRMRKERPIAVLRADIVRIRPNHRDALRHLLQGQNAVIFKKNKAFSRQRTIDLNMRRRADHLTAHTFFVFIKHTERKFHAQNTAHRVVNVFHRKLAFLRKTNGMIVELIRIHTHIVTCFHADANAVRIAFHSFLLRAKRTHIVPIRYHKAFETKLVLQNIAQKLSVRRHRQT